jgi:dihydropyrimidinase
MDLVIANGLVVTAEGRYRADLGIRDGRIAQIGGDMPAGVARLDATGRYVVPGGVDPHTHFDGRSQGTTNADDWLSGSTAAACGGTTTVVDMCFPEKGGTLRAGVDEWDRRAVGKSIVDYGYHVTVLDDRAEVAAEVARLPEYGVSTVKMFMAYRGQSMVDDATLYRTLRIAAERGLLCLVHAENGHALDHRARQLVADGKTAPKYHAVARPPRIEAEATARAVALAELAGAPLYVVHVSCAEALEEIERGRARGVEVHAETCPQYLFCSVDDLDRPGFEGAKYVCSPALRERWQQDVLWAAIRDARIQVVASDHSAYNFGQPDHKPRGRDDFTKIPHGVPGVEERMTLLYQGVVRGRISLERWVDAVATAPARIHGLLPRKGTIAVGADADLVLWDPEAEWTIAQPALHHRVDYTPYEGLAVKGAPDVALSRGEVLVRGRQPVGIRPGRGQFLRRPLIVA